MSESISMKPGIKSAKVHLNIQNSSNTPFNNLNFAGIQLELQSGVSELTPAEAE